MSDAANVSDPTSKPSRAGRLLSLVRKLIDYGRELADTIRQRVAADPMATGRAFGTTEVTAILAMIARALLRASALEARVTHNAARLDEEPRPASTSAPRKPRAPRPPAEAAAAAEPILARLPTEEQIAAEIRRRPIGAIIVDICLDLGIMPSNELWPEIYDAVTRFGGSLIRLVSDSIDRSFRHLFPDPSASTPTGLPGPSLRFQAPDCTGPP